MAKRNGGIIGPDNVPAGPLGAAGGVWRLEDAFNAQKAGTWPVVLGYQIPNSCRFNSGSTDYLQRTPASAGSLTTWTYSFWTKRSKLATAEQYLSAGPRSSPNVEDQIYSISTDAISWYDGTANATVLRTTQLFRDVSAWYHLMFVWDTTNATAGNRARIYVNGTEVTSFSIDNNPSQNAVSKINGTGQHRIGQTGTVAGENLDGYLAEVIFIDGQALTPSSFGETDATTGIWIPKAYTGSFGTNGFYLNFANSGDLGNDVSGNNNDWTVNGLTSIDQSYDSPTNNFNTLNTLIPLGSNFSAPTEGNLSLSQSGTGNSGFYASTIIPSAGKWYFEVKTTTVSSSDRTNIGIANFESVTGTNSIEAGDYKGISVSTGTTGRISVTNGATTTEFDVAGYVPVANDIMMFAVDMDNSRVYIGKNGTWFTTAAASGGNPATSTGYFSPVLGNGFAVGAGHGAGVSASATNLYNFGYPPFTISSGNADANGFGNFEYAVPSGYYALCSKNLALYG